MDEPQYNTLLTYENATENDDFYALLNLPRSNPPPTDPEIRSAYRSLTFSFHPDKQPPHLHEAAQRYFERINEAYETLIDQRKRAVYDLLGAEGVRREWSATGVMGGGKRGAGEEDMRVGVRAKSPEEFRRWFLELMKRRERKAVNSMVQSRGSLTLGIDASDMFSVSDDGTEFFVHVPSPESSSYAIGYSFKAPLPTPSGILGEMVGEDDDGDQEENNAKNDTYDEAYQTQLQIDASISGPVEHLVQEVKLRFPDGTERPAELPLRPQLATTDVRLGATVSRVIGDTTSSKGILSKWPLSFLGNSGVSLNAHVLPFPFVHTSITKAVTPIQGTNPFQVSFTNTFMNWPHLTPPRVGIATAKKIGQRKQAFLSWSSGSLIWPTAFHQMLVSFETALNANLAVAALQQPSSLTIGVISEPSRPQDVVSLEDDGDEDEEEDGEFQELREKTRKTTQAAESWQVQIQASPAAGGLTFGYGRNIFSGKPATEPVRSEWSSEGYHGVPAEPETRSVRLELTTTLSMDLSLAYSLEAVRQVGEFTRMGFGVSLDGASDLALTISWSRLGQKIKIPISLCSQEVINADIAAAVTVFPWLAYCAVEFGFLRPRERKKRRRLVARKQRQLKKLIPKKRTDSAQAIEMMAEQVNRRQSKEEAQNGLVITRAEYGYMPSTHKKNKSHDPAEYEVIDVTVPIAALVDRSQLVIPRETIKFQLLGFHDPAPLLPKKLRVWYQYHGKEHYVEANDSEGISCPMRLHLL